MAKKFVKVTGLHNVFSTYSGSNSLNTTALSSSVDTAKANSNSILFIDADSTDVSTYGFDADSHYIWSQGKLFNQRQIPLIESTQSSATGSWTGNCRYLQSLQDKQVIIYHLNKDTSGNVTLNLTLANGTTTGAKNVYHHGSVRMTTQIRNTDYVILIYSSANNAWYATTAPYASEAGVASVVNWTGVTGRPGYWADQQLQTGSSTQMSPRFANAYAGVVGGATGVRVGASYVSGTTYSGGCYMLYDNSKSCLQFVF